MKIRETILKDNEDGFNEIRQNQSKRFQEEKDNLETEKIAFKEECCQQEEREKMLLARENLLERKLKLT